MKLRGSLYTCSPEMTSDEGFLYKVRFDPGCFIYRAHFPGEPITPGVCILQIALELLEEHLGGAVEVKKVRNAKFLNIIVPSETAEVEYRFHRIQRDGEDISLLVTVEHDNVIYAKLSLECRMTVN